MAGQPTAPTPRSQPASRYLSTQFSAVIVTRDARFSHVATHRPEYAVIERQADGQLVFHAPEVECSSPVRQARERDMLDPHAHYLERNPVTGRNHPRSVIDATRPEYYQVEGRCSDRSFTIFEMDRAPQIRVQYIRSYPDQRNGRTLGRGRTGTFEPLQADDLEDALAQARQLFIAALEEDGSPYATEYERDHSQMVMAEYRDYVGLRAGTRVRGMRIFDFGWFSLYRPEAGNRAVAHVFRPRPGASYSEIERIGEAITFTENDGQPGSRTVIVAPYPYGTTAGGSLFSAFTGIDSNAFNRSDYHMRQIIVCEATSGLMEGTSFVRYNGDLSLSEQLPTTCRFRSESALRSFIGHFESGGQARNEERQSLFTRMTGGGVVTNNTFPCGEKPEFTIRDGVMQLHSEPCDAPSEPLTELSRPLSSNERLSRAYRFSETPLD